MEIRFTDEQRRGKVVAGVDTHSAMHWLCVLGEHGDVELSMGFDANSEGYDLLAKAIGDPAGCLAVGVEGTASYGAGLARRLRELGFTVYEVLRPKRAARGRGEGKNDAADAERAARDVMAGRGLSVPKAQDGWVEQVRFLMNARDCLVKSCTQLVNTARSLLETAPEPLRREYGGMAAERLMPALAGIEGGGAGQALASIGRAWVASHGEEGPLEDEMRALIGANCPSLLAIYGCGTLCAAKIAVAAGDNPGRIGSEAKLAALFGASPVEASSGKTKRHRLNRGGNRAANSALHQIAVTRAKNDPETRAYMERRCGDGAGRGRKSKKEALRCLKRYIVREVHHALMNPFDCPALAGADELKAARLRSKVSQKELAGILGCSKSEISRLENGKRRCKDLARRYREWVDLGMPVEAEADSGKNEIAA